MAQLEHEEGLQELVSQVQDAALDPYTAAQQILADGMMYGSDRAVRASDC
jgi:hypothetical protein